MSSITAITNKLPEPSFLDRAKKNLHECRWIVLTFATESVAVTAGIILIGTLVVVTNPTGWGVAIAALALTAIAASVKLHFIFAKKPIITPVPAWSQKITNWCKTTAHFASTHKIKIIVGAAVLIEAATLAALRNKNVQKQKEPSLDRWGWSLGKIFRISLAVFGTGGFLVAMFMVYDDYRYVQNLLKQDCDYVSCVYKSGLIGTHKVYVEDWRGRMVPKNPENYFSCLNIRCYLEHNGKYYPLKRSCSFFKLDDPLRFKDVPKFKQIVEKS